METQSDFEREISARIDKVEAAILALSHKVDRLGVDPAGASPRSTGPGPRPQPAGAETPKLTPTPRTVSGLRSLGEQSSPERGADWWLARAGAGLTVIAVILLYQYAVSHGWITPWVRVLTGTLIGAGLMYWGRKMAAPESSDASPVALRELMMGAALAAWYITAFAVSARYHLIPVSTSRYLFLLLSIAGGTLSLKERRSGLALLAVTAGFLGPAILADGPPSVPAYAFYIAVLGALSVILYLMRGWQSVLWISFLAICLTLSIPVFDTQPVIMSLMSIAMAIAYTRAPTLRRGLVATGAERYTEPIRSNFAKRSLAEMGRLLKLFSPAAGPLDSFSVWLLTIGAPLAGLSLLGSAWPRVSEAVWGAVAIVLAVVAHRMCKSGDENSEITHVEGAASLVWATYGMIGVAYWIFPEALIHRGTIALAVFAVASIAALSMQDGQRFVAARATARLIAGISVLWVLFEEAGFLSSPMVHQPEPATTISELVAIAAGVVAWREMRRRQIGGDIANVLVLMSYGSLLLVDARVLGGIWMPLVTATFAIAGTILLIMSRKENNKLLRVAGGATLALVLLRLFFVDMDGVETIWRVILFLGVGALFLFTSRQLQVERNTPSGST